MTRSILNLGSTAIDADNFYPMPKADLVVIDTVVKPNGDREATYQLTSGNELYPLSVRVGAYPPKNGTDLYNLSVRVNTYVSDDGGDETVYKPGFVTIATGMPFGYAPDLTGMMKALHHALSLILPVVAGSFVDDSLDELKFGVVGAVDTHADTGGA